MMPVRFRFAASAAFLLLLVGLPVSATELKPITFRPDYHHDKFVTRPTEIVRQFEAFTVSFDWKDDDGEAWGIPNFVAYEMKRLPTDPGRRAGTAESVDNGCGSGRPGSGAQGFQLCLLGRLSAHPSRLV